MKAKIFFIALFAMMIFAVQGYAQRSERRGGERSQPRVEHSAPSNRGSAVRSSAPSREHSYSRPQNSHGNSGVHQSRSVNNDRPTTTTRTPQQPTRRDAVRSNSASSSREQVRSNSSRAPQNNVRRAPATAPRHDNVGHNNHVHRPSFRSGVHYHSHRCRFDSWDWYHWGGYHNRFICHRHYRNRYFDSLLGYYLWGTIDVPTRIDIGNMSFTRYNNTLKIKVGYDVTYLDLYRYNNISYTIGYTTVTVITQYGYATIYFADDYGNTATYRL